MAREFSVVKPPAKPRRERVMLKASSSWWTPQQAADHLGVTVASIYAACASKGLRSSKLGHSTIRIKPAWVDAWAESKAPQEQTG